MRALAPLVAAVALTVSVDGSGLAQCPGRPRHEAAEQQRTWPSRRLSTAAGPTIAFRSPGL